ncbi:MAG: hypothetical protein BZY80_02695 [SAR202 cluster bacterium Io17-Chloro-G2]|nr:MAG: hypothetical protein BZY80_02695 [SAR202 cluster bacterium Io17-Chloro-G2]
MQALAQQAPNNPLLLIGAYRDAELRERPLLSRPVLDMYRNRLALSLPLSVLTRDEVSQLITQALNHNPSSHLLDLIFEQTECNAFHIEELVGYLVERGALTLEGEVWDVLESALQMPDTVKLVVEDRLELLDQETRLILAKASVIGQEFTLPVLQEVTEAAEDALVDAMDRAVESRVLVPRSSIGQEVYAFAGNQVREVLYQDTGTARRRRYHLRAGEAIEKVHGRRLEEHYGSSAAEERWPEAEAAFQRAADINRQHGLVYDQARTMYDWAVMRLHGAAPGDRESSLELLDQALTLFQCCDAKKDVDRAVALQQQVPSQLTDVSGYPGGLTEREVEVLRLVAAGKTNPEIGEELFISPRTVTAHVSRILNKINAANRAEAATYASRQGFV